jgi:acetyl-CoA C-acetyltransferase
MVSSTHYCKRNSQCCKAYKLLKNYGVIKLSNVFIISAKRTVQGKFGKTLKDVPATELGGIAIKAALEDSHIPKENVEEVIFGNVIQAGNGQNPAGQCSALGGLDPEVTKNTVNVVCASGMLALENASREISLNERDIIIAGGTESMSRTPYLLSSKFRTGVKNMFSKQESLIDSMYNDGLMDAFNRNSMGFYADASSKKYDHTRKMVDEYAFQSYERSLKASKNGFFKDEIVTVNGMDTDEGIRETSMEKLSALNPSFSPDGIHTAGNSSQISDGASALVLASGKAVDEYGLKPIAKITGYWSASLDSKDYIEAPVKSTREFFKKKGWNIRDFDLVEHNEAFSGGCLIVRDQLGIDNDSFNVNGGAIAFGHPLGSSGSRIVVTLIHALVNNNMEKGLATLCHGGGGGHTISVELVK